MIKYLVLWVNGGGIMNVGVFEGGNPHEARTEACKAWKIVPETALDLKTRPLDSLETGWSWWT